MLAIYCENMVLLWACVERRKLLFDFKKAGELLLLLLPRVGDSSRLPDPVSVETAKRSCERAAKKKVLTFPFVEGEDYRGGGKQRQGLSQHMLQ